MKARNLKTIVAALLKRMGHKMGAKLVRELDSSFYTTWEAQKNPITFLRKYTGGLYYDAKFLNDILAKGQAYVAKTARLSNYDLERRIKQYRPDDGKEFSPQINSRRTERYNSRHHDTKVIGEGGIY